jgi:putative nucleotidyltransferase with HDIG domain
VQPTRITPTLPTTLTIEDIVARTADLPTLPAAALAVMRETDSETGSAQSVGRYLAQDGALAARVLRLANSSYYGLSRSVMDVTDAVVVLGMRNVRNLALVASTYPWMNKPLKGYALAPHEMWRHSFGVAVAASLAGAKSRRVSPEEAFVAGLLHDLGKTAISVWLENKLPAMLRIAEREGLPFDAVERKVLGYDHMEVGAHMAESWNLPQTLVDVMRYHHRPGDLSPANPMVDCVHVGDYLAGSMGFGLGGDGLGYQFDESALSRIGLGIDDLDQLADAFMVSYDQHERLFEETK